MTINATNFDWQTDTIRAAASNAQLEGNSALSAIAYVPTVRLRNTAQISNEVIAVTGTQDIVNKAGRGSELAYRVAQSSIAVKRDLEFNILANVKANAGADATARVSCGLVNWIRTNTDKGTGAAADPVWSTTAGITTPTTILVDGTTRPTQETSLRNVLQKIYTQGGNPSTIMCGPATKQTISQFGGVATKTFYQDAAAPSVIVSAADVYVSDYGKLAVIPNRFQRQVSSFSTDIFVLDWDLLAVGYLRPFQVQELAKTGDAEIRQIIVEWGFLVKNELGLGIVRDVNT